MMQEELKDIALCGETSTIQFKEQFTGQKEIAKEMIAFANSRGGQIFFGIKDKTGELAGLSYDEIQVISRELGNAANEQVRPTIYIDTDVVRADDKHFLVCTIEEGKTTIQKSEITTIKKPFMDGSTTQKDKVTTQKGEIAAHKEGLKDGNTTQKSNSTAQKDLDTTQKKVLEYFKTTPKEPELKQPMLLAIQQRMV